MGTVMDGGGGLGKYYLGLGFDCEDGTLALWDRDCFIFLLCGIFQLLLAGNIEASTYLSILKARCIFANLRLGTEYFAIAAID